MRRVFAPKWHPKSMFFDVGTAKPNLAKSLIFFRFSKDFRSSELRRSVEKRSQNEAGLGICDGPRFETVFGRFWGPKTEEKRTGIRFLRSSKKEGFAKAMEVGSPWRGAPGPGGFPLSIWLCV